MARFAKPAPPRAGLVIAAPRQLVVRETPSALACPRCSLKGRPVRPVAGRIVATEDDAEGPARRLGTSGLLIAFLLLGLVVPSSLQASGAPVAACPVLTPPPPREVRAQLAPVPTAVA